MSDMSILVPFVTAASIAPNPASINQSFQLLVEVAERSVALQPYFYYAEEIFAGEV